jgi:hypothetical protein
MKTSFGDLAVHLLNGIEHAELEKTSATAYTSMKTEVGAAMVKLAGILRDQKPAEVTNEDLAEFRKRYGV